MTDVDGKNVMQQAEAFDVTIFYGKAQRQNGFTITNFMGDVNTIEAQSQQVMRSDCIIDNIRMEILTGTQTVPTTFALRSNGVDLFAEVFATLQTHDRTLTEEFEVSKDDLVNWQIRGGNGVTLDYRVSMRMRFKPL